jgi:hypothetical protein
LDPETNKFTLDVLKTTFPEGVKPDRKEAYLSDEEFIAVLGQDRDSFNKLAVWKQKKIK